MSIVTAFPAAILETICTRLVPLFLAGAGGDATAARQAVAQMLAAYAPRTEEELCLAANIIAFSFHALEALGQAADPSMSITRVLRLRGGAVSLSRQAENSRRSLAQLQKARQPAAAAEPRPAETKTPEPAKTEPRAGLTRQTSPLSANPGSSEAVLRQAEEDRQRNLRIQAGLRRIEERAAAAAVAQTMPMPVACAATAITS